MQKFKKRLAFLFELCYYTKVLGGVAQLGERLNGIQKVIGSIPTVSTTKTALKLFVSVRFTFYLLLLT